MKILIIEDDPSIIRVIGSAFKLGWPEAHIVSACLGEEGIRLVETESPDAVILDLGLPDINGFEVLKQIRLFSNLPILILTVASEESDMVMGLSNGADDYMIKPFRQLELLARIKAIMRRHRPAEEDTSISCGPLHFGSSILDLMYGEKSIKVTRIEGIILYELMKTPDKVVPSMRLAEAVWGEDYPESTDRLRVHIRRLREKIEDDPHDPQLIINKPGIGYLLKCSDSPEQ